MDILLILLSCFSGVVAGMGMGGGTFLIPVLTLVFAMPQKTAQAMNLLVFIPTAVVSLVIHMKNHFVAYKIGFRLIAVGVVASVLASWLALNTNQEVLRRLFGGFLVLVGLFQLTKAIVQAKQKNVVQTKKTKVWVFNGKMFK